MKWTFKNIIIYNDIMNILLVRSILVNLIQPINFPGVSQSPVSHQVATVPRILKQS